MHSKASLNSHMVLIARLLPALLTAAIISPPRGAAATIIKTRLLIAVRLAVDWNFLRGAFTPSAL